MLQEHFVSSQGLRSFQHSLRAITDHKILLKSAKKRNKRYGRNSGGLALIVKPNIYLSNINTSNFRIQCIKLLIDGKPLQCVNIYLPNERKRNIQELQTVLEELNKIMFKYPHPLIIGGDMNYDVTRKDTVYNKIIKHFLKINNLKLVWDTSKFDVKCTYLHHNKSTSVIDHFAYRGKLKVIKCGVDNTNQFGHSPIWVEICLT